MPNRDTIIRARSTGAMVDLVDNRNRQYMDDENRWYTVCVDHGYLLGHQTKENARTFQSHPEDWCDDCARAVRRD